MKQSNRLYFVAFTQMLVAGVMTRQWLVAGDGVALLLAVVAALLTVIVAITGYRIRNSRAPARSDPRVLRRIASVGGVTGTIALIALLWRVSGQWIRLGEPTNLVLAMFCIFGLGCAVFGVLLLKEQRVP